MLWSGLVALLSGLAIAVWNVNGPIAYTAFATAVTTCVSAAILGNVGEHFAGPRAESK